MAQNKPARPADSVAGSAKVDAPSNRKAGFWLMQAIGAVLLIAGWAYFALPHFVSAQFFLDSVVFSAVGGYAMLAAYNARRETVALEKKLRYSLIRRNMELESMATRDELTLLFRRRHFFDRFERELQRAKASRRALSVLVIDVNGMEQINSSHGFGVGDRVLASFARFLADHARGSDVPARIDGDQFAVLMPDCDEPSATAAVTRLLKALDKAELLQEEGLSLKVTAAIGKSGYPWAADTVGQIISAAHESMSAHKGEQTSLFSAVATTASHPEAS